MGLSTLLLGKRLARKGEDFSRAAYLDTLGRTFVSSLGFVVLAAVAAMFYTSIIALPAMPVMVLIAVFWLLAVLVKLLGFIGHYRRLRVLGFGGVFITFYFIDTVVTRLLFTFTNVYLAFKKTDTEKAAAEKTSLYGCLWQVVAVLYAMAPFAVLGIAAFMVFSQPTSLPTPQIITTEQE